MTCHECSEKLTAYMEGELSAEAEAQIAAQPKVMTRPVIRHLDKLHLGWDDTIQTALLAD